MFFQHTILRRSVVSAGVIVMLSLTAFLAVKPRLLDDVHFSRAVYDRNGKLLRLTTARDQQYRLYTPLLAISPALRDAVLLHEDQYFYRHPGVNPVALVRAAIHSLGSGRRIGASTITMQLARIKSGLNSRHIPGKILQILCALRLELHYSKDELLTAYLNLASYGGNIEGIGAASLIYFHAEPAKLTLPQALTLAVIPQSPARRRPDAHNPAKPALIAARNRLFTRWLAMNPDAADQKLFFNLPLASYARDDLPFHAPHLANSLLAQNRAQTQIHTTIDLSAQRMLDEMLRRYVADRREIGINNASALLVDTRNMEVLVSIGSARFSSTVISGQVDGTRAKRSPGSTLKPFVYALALDQGLVHPQSVLGDAPTSFGSANPENFDRNFRGPVSAHDALRFSRNIPAMKLAAQLHDPDFYEFLHTTGIGGLRAKKDYGLALVLGGVEVTMRELAALYAALANDGMLRPLVFQRGETDGMASSSRQLFSPEASFMVLDMLRDTPRPYQAVDSTPVYWKTGTSNGFHDAWTAGIFGPYALVVWVGNFNGKNNPALIGIRTAAPLFFAMVDALRGYSPMTDKVGLKAAQLRLRRVQVCATTGDLDLTGCPAVTRTWFIPGVSPIQGHNVYRRILIDTKTGHRACRSAPGVTVTRTFEVWPSDLQQTLRRAGMTPNSMPPWQEGCEDKEVNGQKPVITSPVAQVAYHVRREADQGEAIGLEATADGSVRELHWFAGQRYLGKSSPNASLDWRPLPGRYDVRVVDDYGRSGRVKVQVVLAP